MQKAHEWISGKWGRRVRHIILWIAAVLGPLAGLFSNGVFFFFCWLLVYASMMLWEKVSSPGKGTARLQVAAFAFMLISFVVFAAQACVFTYHGT